MKLKYVGESFGVDSLTNGRVYECLGLEYPEADGRERPGRPVGDRRG